jgi:glutaryl-CoA dehydrogenase
VLVKKEVSPIIEDYAQRAEFPKQIIKGLGGNGGPIFQKNMVVLV